MKKVVPKVLRVPRVPKVPKVLRVLRVLKVNGVTELFENLSVSLLIVVWFLTLGTLAHFSAL